MNDQTRARLAERLAAARAKQPEGQGQEQGQGQPEGQGQHPQPIAQAAADSPAPTPTPTPTPPPPPPPKSKRGKLSPHLAEKIKRVHEADQYCYRLVVIENRPQFEVAKLLGVDRRTVSRRIERERKRLRAEFVGDEHERRLDATAQLKAVIRSAWQSFEKSKENAAKIVTKKTGEGTDAETEETRTTEAQAGDRAFLAEIRECVADIREIWGVDVQKDDQQNQNQNQISSTVNVHVQNDTSVFALRNELLSDPEYLEFQQQRALRQDVFAGPLPQGSVERPLENGPTPDGA